LAACRARGVRQRRARASGRRDVEGIDEMISWSRRVREDRDKCNGKKKYRDSEGA